MIDQHYSQEEKIAESGAYTSNLLGTIRSHLQGLQGFDTMALELIQNADDAGAEEVVFDIRTDGLQVWNSGTFRYCGELKEAVCPFYQSEGYSCDFHRIADFGSGGKLSRSENIGRFGIGFSSTYQICDQPRILSSGIELTLMPEEQKWQKRENQDTKGTTFFLPWATDPRSAGRIALGVSHVTDQHIEQLLEDFEQVLRSSLLFLRHLRRAKLLQQGEPVFSVAFDRGDADELIVSFEPDGEIEQWLVVRAEAEVADVYQRFSQLESLDRKRAVSVAIRIDPEPLGAGRLFAFLPTRQSTGLPLHINADFFPEDSRKAIIFEGHQHQQAWNECLIEAAAIALAEDLLRLRDQLGHKMLWQLLSAALQITQDRSSTYPAILHKFWGYFQDVVEGGAEIGFSAQETYAVPAQLLIAHSLSEQQQSAFLKIGGSLVHEDLRTHRNALIQLGVKQLTLEQFLIIAERSLSSVVSFDEVISSSLRDTLFIPFWEILEVLLPVEKIGQKKFSIERSRELRRLKELPLIMDSEGGVASIEMVYRPLAGITSVELASHFPMMRFVDESLLSFLKLSKLINPMTIQVVASSFEMMCRRDKGELLAGLGAGNGGLRDFYLLLARIDRAGESDNPTYGGLRRLPIWRSGGVFTTLEELMLPGNFSDPTGQARLVDSACLSQEASAFLEKKLGVKRQSIEEYVRLVVPRFFSGEGPDNENAYKRLVLALANHAGILDDDDLRSLLSETPLVPSQDGGWNRVDQLYYRTDELVEVLGENRSLWINEERLPMERSVHSLIENLGVLHAPAPVHMVDRILTISSAVPPDAKARAASGAVFYELCRQFDKSSADANLMRTLHRLVSVQCLPALGDTTRWYMPEELYAPYRYHAFVSQVQVLDFNAQKLDKDLLEVLSVSTVAETKHVVNHLLHCIEFQSPVSPLVYQILDERAKKESDQFLPIKNKPCIYVETENRFIRPNQLYLIPQELGSYSYAVPRGMDLYKDFFEAVGVKQKPEAKDYIDIILEIVEKHYTQQTILSEVDQAVYIRCVEMLVDAHEMGEVEEEKIEPLREAPSVLNVVGKFCYPYELLLQDSDWHVKLFGDDLQKMLCKADYRWWPLYQLLGIQLLSQRASVELDYVGGQEKMEEEVRDKLVERSGLFLRLLHDETAVVRARLSEVLEKLCVVSHSEIRIKATINIDGEPFSSTPSSVYAYCDESLEKMVIVRPFNNRSWLHIYTMLLHRLLPQATPSYISQLSMNLSTLANMSVMDGQEYLSEANIPLLEEKKESGDQLDLRSRDLGAIGDVGGESGDTGIEAIAETDFDPESKAGGRVADEKQGGQTDGVLHGKEFPSGKQSKTFSDDKNIAPDGSSARGGRGDENRKKGSSRKSWDQKLRSYVRQKEAGQGSEQERPVPDQEHNLHIEMVTREIVCDYERDRGRIPEEMSQTHPGYDIISRRESSEEIIDRYIEVKGRDGEWGGMGVSVSRTQFSNAQDLGDKYWLYVVEYALDESAARVHPIQNPAMKVDSFMFDGGWRDVVDDEKADPTLRFVEGARVECALGVGVIEKVTDRGHTKSLVIDFGGGKKRPMPLNLATMKILDSEDG